MNCTALATALSAAYFSTAPFTGNTTADLQQYLSHNGVLMTMCLDVNATCATASPSSPEAAAAAAAHWSGSWVNNQTGFKIVPNALVGLIADPLGLDIRCIFPTDAGTDARDDNGCGPLAVDPQYGSDGAAKLGPVRRAEVRAYIENGVAKHFPGKSWSEIPCVDMFHAMLDPNHAYDQGTSWLQAPNSTQDDCAAFKAEGISGSTMRWTPMRTPFVEAYAAIVGEPICNETAPSAVFETGYWYEYDGFCAWDPEEWVSAANVMMQLIEAHPQMTIWNEIVARLPQSLPEEAAAAQASFFIKIPGISPTLQAEAIAAAKANSLRLGGKPVLEIDAEKAVSTGVLFECYENQSTLDR